MYPGIVMANARETRFAELYAPLITCCLDTVFVSACMTRAGASNPDRLLRDFQEALRLAAKKWQSLDADSDSFASDVHDIMGGSPRSGGALRDSAVSLFGSEAAATYAAREALLEAARDVFNQPWVMMRLQCDARLELRDTVTAALLRTITFIVLPGDDDVNHQLPVADSNDDICDTYDDVNETHEMDSSCITHDTIGTSTVERTAVFSDTCMSDVVDVITHRAPAPGSARPPPKAGNTRMKRRGGDTFF